MLDPLLLRGYEGRMKTHPISPIPPHGGVYAIKNNTTGHIYIGRSMALNRRFSEWRHAMVYRRALKNGPISDLLDADPDLDHWTFNILYESADATPGMLAQKEDQAIRKARTKVGQLLLNSMLGSSEPLDPSKASCHSTASLTTLRDEDGKHISQAAAAKVLGCRLDTLRKRLAVLRKKKGVTEISLPELMKK